MGSSQVPKEVAHDVAAFLWARSRETAPTDVSAEDLERRWAEAGMVRDYQKALDRGRAVTADNLAYTLLMAAARYAGHRDYQARWQAWTPFGDLTPGSRRDGPTTDGHPADEHPTGEHPTDVTPGNEAHQATGRGQ